MAQVYRGVEERHPLNLTSEVELIAGCSASEASKGIGLLSGEDDR